MSPLTTSRRRSRRRSRTGRGAALAGLVAAGLALTGCYLPWSSTRTADSPRLRTSELADAGGRPCPEELPLGEDPSGLGFGTGEVAGAIPSLHDPQEAWVCQYHQVDVDRPPGAGTTYGWRRAGQPVPVVAGDLPRLRAALDGLLPADRDGGACPADLGPRWAVVYSHDGDLTGVVVDDYGCRDVRPA